MPTSSVFWKPLDHLLGTRAALATLRVLIQHQGLLPASRIAIQAGLSRQSVYKALQAFTEQGLVIAEGAGHSSLFRLNRKHSAARPLISLFDVERKQSAGFFDTIRDWAGRTKPPPKAVWLYGSVARHTDTAQSDIDIALLGHDDSVRQQGDELRELLADWGERNMLRPSVITLSRAELKAMNVRNAELWENVTRDAVPIFGLAPSDSVHG